MTSTNKTPFQGVFVALALSDIERYCWSVTERFEIIKKLPRGLGRAGVFKTEHGDIETPVFLPVATKATLKSMTPEQVKEANVDIMIANAYHLFLQPGEEVIKEAGGIHKFMNWDRPLSTDSGGFQVFSLGAAFNTRESKLGEVVEEEGLSVYDQEVSSQHGRLAIVDDEGVTFTSHIDGSLHRFTPERSIEIQQAIGADIMFAFDEFVAPKDKEEKHKKSMDRTFEWAKRSLKAHRQNTEAQKKQSLFGIVQGGRFEHLRKESAKNIGSLNFDGFGIGGSFSKDDIGTAVKWVTEELPEEKPRHLLGIGSEPVDLFLGVENGVDMFDCVSPTRLARTGTIYTSRGKINIMNEKYIKDFSPVDPDTPSYTSTNYTKAYLAHLFRSNEMLASTLASIHNVYFLATLVKNIRQSILDDRFFEFKEEFLRNYGG